jgi:hypothetical protein
MSIIYDLAQQLHIGKDLLFPISIAIAILLISAFGYWHSSRRINEAKREIKALTEILEKANFKGIRSFELSISQTKNKKLKSLLQETKDNLVKVEGDLGPDYFSLRNYDEIWSARSVLTGRMNLSLFETMPNILIGVGLMFTFGFLAIALTHAGQAMDIAANRDEEMKQLIATAGGKFITSIVGLLCSLIWNWRAKVKIEQLQRSITELHTAFRKIAPDTAAQAIIKQQHSILKEILAENRSQVVELKRFETDIAVALANAIGNALEPYFKKLGSELIAAIKSLNDQIASVNEEALQRMITEFLEQLRSTSSREMQDFKRALSDLADKLDTAGTKIKLEIGVASMTFGTATSTLESAITKTKDTVEQLDVRLDQANSLIDNSGEKFEQISTKFFNSLRALDTLVVGVENFVDKIQYNIGTLNKISDSLDHTVESQRHVASDFRDAVPKMVKALSDAVLSIKESTQLTLTSVSALNTEFKNTNKSVDMTVESLTSGVDQYTEKVKDLHLMIDDKIGEAISKIGLAVTTLTKTIDELIDALP